MAPAALRLERLCAAAAQTIRQRDKPKCSERMIRSTFVCQGLSFRELPVVSHADKPGNGRAG